MPHKRESTCLCPVCKSNKIEIFSEIDNFPLLLFPVPIDIKDKIVSKKIISYLCTECKHIFNDPINSEIASIIYGEYYKYYPFDDLDSMYSVYREPFEKIFSSIIQKIDNNKDSPITLLEIGCSSGKQLNFFKKYGIKTFGIDPSPLTADECEEFISGMYEDYVFDEKFNIIISRFNLEHINNINTFFQKVNTDLCEDGILFIQVPNIAVFIKNFIPLFLAHEHIHYFNAYSLFITTRLNGFELIKADYKFNQSIIFSLRKRGNETNKKRSILIDPIPNNLYTKYKKKQLILKTQFEKILYEKEKIYFYGAGLILCWIIYELKLNEILRRSIIIDDNPLVQGKYMPHTNNQIQSFENIEFHKNSILILTLNKVYHENVISKLIAKNINLPIYIITENGLEVKK